MKKFIQQKLKDQKGMTLIELLAVIVIIAIIAAIAIPAIGNIIENSRVGAAKSDILNAQSAAELYLADNPGVTEVTLENLMGTETAEGATTTVGSSYLDSQASLTDFVYYTSGTTPTIYATATPDDNILVTAGAKNAAGGVTKARLSALPSNTDGTFGTAETGGVITVNRSYNPQ